MDFFGLVCFSIYFGIWCCHFGSHPYSMGSLVLFDAIHSSIQIGVLRRNSIVLFSLSVCGCCAWIRVGAFAHQKSLCRLIGVVSPHTRFSSCIAIYSNCYFSLPFCWFPCFVICLLLHITHKYCCLQANRSTYDIIIEGETKNNNSLSKGFLYFCGTLCWHSHFSA